jgi:porphobilinogen synthase
MRRLRRTSKIRNIVREIALTIDDLIYPVFINEGINAPEPILSMPGQFRLSINDIVKEAKDVSALGIPGIIIFGIPLKKDELGTSASDDNGIVQQAVRLIKKELGDELVIITDICLCQYTSHGHCGIVKGNEVDNDLTLERLQNIAVSHARAGTDIVAPSAMMDGQVRAIRNILDRENYKNVGIMAYSAKMASNFYSPFRDAADSTPSFGNRNTYQMAYTNSNEALREADLDIKEGADIIMVKPALAYLDLIYRIKLKHPIPLATYNVSGEYSMIKAAAANGWINEKEIVLEVISAIRRAGADMILTYFAKDIARWLLQK